MKKIFMRSIFTAISATVIVFNLNTSATAASPGALDPSFGIAGRVVTDIFGNDNLADIAVQPNGKIIAVGANGTNDFVVVRYNANGSLDTTFSGDGIAFTDFSNANDSALGLAIQVDGKIVVSGSSGNDFAIARYNFNGTLDTTFDTDGKVTVVTGRGSGIAMQQDGKIVVIGNSNSDFGVVRLNSNGSLDTTFDGDGRVSTDLGSNDTPVNVKIQPDGKIVLAGNRGNGGDFAVVRYNTNGSLDTTFSGDGIFTNDFSTSESYSDLTIQENGSIVVVGRAFSNVIVVRLTSAGAFDSTFDLDGNVLIPLDNSAGRAITIQSDGKILVGADIPAATTIADVAIARLNTNGSLDSSFGNNGIVLTKQNGSGSPHFALVGDKLVVGNLTNATTDFALERYNLSVSSSQSGDFDGDSFTDTAVFRPGTADWFVLNSSTNTVVISHFGLNGDIPIDGDFDGDARGDLAIYRPSSGIWFFLRSSDNTSLGAQFGASGDQPVVGDYDKDGKTDIAVFRPASGEWLILRSSSNFSNFFAFPFGSNGDIPIVKRGL